MDESMMMTAVQVEQMCVKVMIAPNICFYGVCTPYISTFSCKYAFLYIIFYNWHSLHNTFKKIKNKPIKWNWNNKLTIHLLLIPILDYRNLICICPRLSFISALIDILTRNIDIGLYMYADPLPIFDLFFLIYLLRLLLFIGWSAERVSLSFYLYMLIKF